MSAIRRTGWIVVAASILWGACSAPQGDLPADWHAHYVAHLKLGETILVATVVADSLDVPWEVTVGADGALWFTEQNGAVYRVDPVSGRRDKVLQVPDVHYQKSRGLLGMALHPAFPDTPHVYLHYTFSWWSPEQQIASRLVRYTLVDDRLAAPHILLDSLPGATYHNGSRVLTTREGYLYLSTGDAGSLTAPQEPFSFAGKILRLRLDGTIPADNPWPGSPVYSIGHRNPQGMVMAKGRLYASEHGPQSDDELNLIEPGRNYGWPQVYGFCDRPNEKPPCREANVAEPLRAWTPTIAVAGLDYYDHPTIPAWRHALLLVSLKGQALRVLKLDERGTSVGEESLYFQQRFGRIRDLAVAPSGDLYLATSNRDWHPRAQPFMYADDLIRPTDDRIIRLTPVPAERWAALAKPKRLVELNEDAAPARMMDENWNDEGRDDAMARGAALYRRQCEMCHRPDGRGVPGFYPPLAGTDRVTGPKGRLIEVVLGGLSEPIEVEGARYDQEMPGFAHLEDAEVAAILTFVRQNWGNQGGAVLAAEVAAVRQDRAGLPRR